MLGAGIARAPADRGIERIVDRIAAEGCGVFLAEAANGLFGQDHFAHRRQRDGFQRARGALAIGIKGADRFQLAAEKIKAQRGFGAGGKQVDQPAAYGKFAAFAHGGDAQIAVIGGPGDQLFAVDNAPGGGRERHGLNNIAWRQALDQGIDRCEHHGALAACGQRRQRAHARGDGHIVGRDAVIGQTVPGGQRQHRMAGQHGAENIGHALQAPAIAGHKDDTGGIVRGCLDALLDQARQHHWLHAVRHIGDGACGLLLHDFVHLASRA